MKSLNINIQRYILRKDFILWLWKTKEGKGSKFLHLADIYLRFNLGPFRMFYCNQFGIVCTRKDVELISNTTYHLARVILLHRLLYFLCLYWARVRNQFVYPSRIWSGNCSFLFGRVLVYPSCINIEEEDKLCSNTWNSTFIFALKQMRFHYFLI